MNHTGYEHTVDVARRLVQLGQTEDACKAYALVLLR
jgi:hypothetical protein